MIEIVLVSTVISLLCWFIYHLLTVRDLKMQLFQKDAMIASLRPEPRRPSFVLPKSRWELLELMDALQITNPQMVKVALYKNIVDAVLPPEEIQNV